MFTNANSFNQDISGWNTAKVGSMISMFELATSFNQNIGNWNTGAVTDMTKMFQHATSFNQNLGNWRLNANVDLRNMFDHSGMDCPSYSATLVGWNANPSTPNGRSLGAAGRTYGPAATTARANLTGTKGWTITGDALSNNSCGGAFITRWNLATEGTGTTQLSFGTATSGTVNYIWEEVSPGTKSGSGSFSGSNLTITGLPSGATIRLSIYPTNFRRIIIGNTIEGRRLLDVEQWGSTAWTSMRDAFFGCHNLNITATDIPNLSATNMDMGQMFQSCFSLKTVPNINSWNTSTVIYMTSMFNNARLFNQNIGSWNTANVIGMVRMFTNANSFNQDISGWNTAKVGSMISMFELATSFNQNIGNWNTGAVTDMTKMFQWATSFNQNLGNWSLNASVDMRNMLDNCGMDCYNYAQTLIGWNATGPNGRSLGAKNLNYGSQATAARANLTGPKGWTITGDVQSNICDAFITRWNVAGTTTLSFGTATSGTVNYTWKEVSPGTKSGSGSFSGNTLTINGLPSTTIDLFIAPANFQRIIIGNNQPLSHRLLDVKQWGTTVWTSMDNAFFGCSNLNITATDIPNLSSVTRMEQMFQSCSNLSTVPNINSWNTSNVEWMSSVFNSCRKFNENIGSWNTSKVRQMRRMFMGSSFNQNIGGWNTANVYSMLSMFENSSFNQNISGWNTAGVEDMSGMFRFATSFNQNIGNWSLKANVNLSNMLDNSGLDCSNYSATLVGWNANPSTPNGRSLGAAGRTYGPQATAARANLTGTKGWTITGDASSIICGISSAPSERLRTELVGEGSKVDENVYPNPFVGRVTIEADLKDVTEKDIKLVDLLGREFRPLSTRKISVTRMELDLSNLVTGQYFIKINSKSGTKVFKVMRQ
jgi:surface protein